MEKFIKCMKLRRLLNRFLRKHIVSGSFSIGDYVFVSKWSDADPNDPWYVSFISEINIDKTHITYKVEGSNRVWANCRKITSEEGRKICDEYPKRELNYR